MGGREREIPHTPWALEGGPWGGKIKRKTQATSGKLCEKRKIKRKNKKNYNKEQKLDMKYMILSKNINNYKFT